jgi:hypothetical protein
MKMRNVVTKLAILVACAMALSLFTASATPLPTCPNASSLATYIATYGGSSGCQIGDKIFSNFSYNGPSASGGGTAPSPSGITVDTINGTNSIFPGDIGLSFDGTWNAPSGATADGNINFEVTVVNGANEMITDAGIVQSGGVTGNGLAEVTENGCSGAVYPCTQTWGVVTVQSGQTNNFANDQIFSPTGTISVTKDINVIGNNGTASITTVIDVFSQTAVPEPRTVSLFLGLALFGGLALRKKFQSARG